MMRETTQMAQQGETVEQAPAQEDGAAEVTVEDHAGDSETDASVEAAAGNQMEDYRALLQRERADFINYRRRVEAERSAQIGQARADALIPILPLLDDLERAAAEVPAELREQPWVKGVLLIGGKLDAAMRAAGLERVDALGQPFDPHLHEAFLNQPHATIPAGHVSMVMRPGYRVGDRVVRAAQVAVSEGASDGAGAGEES
jgi:molecular chaperone GrpE